MKTIRIDDQMTKEIAARRAGYKEGAESAADIAAQYPTTHPFRVDDCVLAKLNLRRKKPRHNARQLQTPEDATTTGFALALAELHRLHCSDSSICEAAENFGLTIRAAKAAGVSPFDLGALRAAGIK